MMIFNSFTVANDYNFNARWPNGRGRCFYLPTNKTFESICLTLAEKFPQILDVIIIQLPSVEYK